MDSYYLGLMLILIGLAGALIDKISNNFKEFLNKKPLLKRIKFVVTIMILVLGGIISLIIYLKSKEFEVYVSPNKAKVNAQVEKSIVLKVTNNKEYAIYDVQAGIFLDNLNIDKKIFKIEPVNEIVTPYKALFWGAGLSNGCLTLNINSISPNSTIEFYLNINGLKIKNDFNILFRIYNWSLESSAFTVPISKEQFNNLPENYNGFFNDDFNKKTGSTLFVKFNCPNNPYFPQINSPELEYIYIYKEN